MKKEQPRGGVVRSAAYISPLLAAGTIVDMGATAAIRPSVTKLHGTVRESVRRDWDTVGNDFERIVVVSRMPGIDGR